MQTSAHGRRHAARARALALGFAVVLPAGSASAQPAVDNTTLTGSCPVFIREIETSTSKSSTTISGTLANAGPGVARGVVVVAKVVGEDGSVMSDYSSRVGNLSPGKSGRYRLSWKNRALDRDTSRREFGGFDLRIEHASCVDSESADAQAIASFQRRNLEAQQSLALIRYRRAGRAIDQAGKGPNADEIRERRMAGTLAALDTEEQKVLTFLDETLPAEVTTAGLSPAALVARPR